MDDIQISALDTEAPTEHPSLMPTEVDVTSELTKSPTSPPTSMPTVATVTSCPQEESSPKEISGGPTMLETSSSLCILTKAFVDADGEMTNIAPIARSYENQPWEKSSGEFANVLLYGLDFEEYTIGSQITLPILDGGAKYFLTSYSYSISDRNSVARLLESATFGTTRIDLESWHEGAVTKDSAAKWIDEQMKKPMTSHREFFRRRVNPRVSFSISATLIKLETHSYILSNVTLLFRSLLTREILVALIIHVKVIPDGGNLCYLEKMGI